MTKAGYMRFTLIGNGANSVVTVNEEIAEAKAAQEEYEKQLASQSPTYEDRLSALESALLEMITGGETGG